MPDLDSGKHTIWLGCMRNAEAMTREFSGSAHPAEGTHSPLKRNLALRLGGPERVRMLSDLLTEIEACNYEIVIISKARRERIARPWATGAHKRLQPEKRVPRFELLSTFHVRRSFNLIPGSAGVVVPSSVFFFPLPPAFGCLSLLTPVLVAVGCVSSYFSSCRILLLAGPFPPDRGGFGCRAKNAYAVALLPHG